MSTRWLGKFSGYPYCKRNEKAYLERMLRVWLGNQFLKRLGLWLMNPVYWNCRNAANLDWRGQRQDETKTRIHLTKVIKRRNVTIHRVPKPYLLWERWWLRRRERGGGPSNPEVWLGWHPTSDTALSSVSSGDSGDICNCGLSPSHWLSPSELQRKHTYTLLSCIKT